MKATIETINEAIQQVINDEPAPSFLSPEFAALTAAIRGVSDPDATPEPHQRLLYEQIGRKTVLLLLSRLQASMNAERALAIMRAAGGKTM